MLNLEIDVAAVIHNIGVIRKHTNAEISAVIKANCYGLGLRLAKYIEDYVDSFSVSSVTEAKEARAIGITKKIYILGIINPLDFQILENVVYTVCSKADVDFLDNLDYSSQVALKINTGMNRLGAPLDDVEAIINQIAASKKIRLDSVFTHFYNAVGASHIGQFELFEKAVANIPTKKHCCASNCLMLDSKYHLDMVRCGLSIYGYGHSKLIPSLTAHTTIAQINEVKSGEHIGYGNYILKHDAKIAIIRAGYADGYRRVQKKLYASSGENRVEVIGQISMDMTAVDISKTNLKLNDRIYLIDNIAKAENLAEAADTVVYEVLTSFNGSRTNRVYKNI